MRVYAIGKTPPACCAVKNQKKRENINFNGFKMHLLDCGEHADTMLHFAKAIGSDIANYTTMTLHEIEPLTYNKGLKSLFSLDKELTRLDAENIVKPNDFVAIPCTAPIELNDLSYHYNRINSSGEKFTPQNIDICIVGSGIYSEKLKCIAQDNKCSYVVIKRNCVTLALNSAINLFPYAENIYKLDEDIFITKNFF